MFSRIFVMIYFFNWQTETKSLFWTDKKFVFFFNCSNWEKLVKASDEFVIHICIFFKIAKAQDTILVWLQLHSLPRWLATDAWNDRRGFEFQMWSLRRWCTFSNIIHEHELEMLLWNPCQSSESKSTTLGFCNYWKVSFFLHDWLMSLVSHK